MSATPEDYITGHCPQHPEVERELRELKIRLIGIDGTNGLQGRILNIEKDMTELKKAVSENEIERAVWRDRFDKKNTFLTTLVNPVITGVIILAAQLIYNALQKS
jgi:hypothetical protein